MPRVRVDRLRNIVHDSDKRFYPSLWGRDDDKIIARVDLREIATRQLMKIQRYAPILRIF